MIKYPTDGNTRVGLLPAINNLAMPTLDEIEDGIDVTCEIVSGGLNLGKDNATQDATPWSGPVEVERPTRVVMSGASLTGFRFQQPDTEPLYEAAVLHGRRFLIVRRGLVFAAAWEAGQIVETYDFEFGTRSPTSADVSTFTVRLFVSDEDDDAVVTA